MDAEDDATDKNESSSSLPSAIGAPLQYVKSFIPGYYKEDEDTEVAEKIGDKLRKKRMKSKRRSSPLNKRDYVGGGVVAYGKKPLGANRSVVRYIGSNLPIAPSQRQYFELFDNSRRAFMSSASTFLTTNLDHVRQHVDQVKYRVVPTLADIGQLVWDDLKVFDGEDEEEYDEEEEDDEDYDEETEWVDDQQEIEEKEEKTGNVVMDNSDKPSTSNEGASDSVKITALEDELAKLRAQIAMIVSNPPSAPAAPLTPSQPAPVAIVAPTVTIPPPPPPLPPAASSAIPTIKIQKGTSKINSSNENLPPGPDMNAVLRGLSSVKLKSVPNRSPGGTPMKPKNKSNKHDSNDPADIIARALREKFRNSKTCYDSPETDSSPSGFSPSPRKHKKSSKVSTDHVRPIPRPRPRPRPRTQKKTTSDAKTPSTTEQVKLF